MTLDFVTGEGTTAEDNEDLVRAFVMALRARSLSDRLCAVTYRRASGSTRTVRRFYPFDIEEQSDGETYLVGTHESASGATCNARIALADLRKIKVRY